MGLHLAFPGNDLSLDETHEEVEEISDGGDDDDAHDDDRRLQELRGRQHHIANTRVAATISAATRVVQPKPMPTRMAVRISGMAAGRMMYCRTCQRVAPKE